MHLRFIQDNKTDPFLNLALEEILLESAIKTEIPVLRIWQNERCVVLGRGQDIEHEVDVNLCKSLNVPILRRFTGGGTVYHDLGNLNITFIFPLKMLPVEKNIQAASLFYTQLIASTLTLLGYSSISTQGMGNIFVGNRKISGSAGHLRQSWYLHHATLLFDADLALLEKLLLVKENDPDKKMQSKYAPTINLHDFAIDTFAQELVMQLTEKVSYDYVSDVVFPAELEKAKELSDIRYRSTKWINKRKKSS